MSSSKILLALEPHDPALRGRPGVLRCGADFCLTDDVGRGPIVALDGRLPGFAILPDDHRLEGGLLPPGAVSAILTDDAGVRRSAETANGVWAIVLDQPYDCRLSPVCFRDADQNLVVGPQRPDWPRAAVLDAPELCPACDSEGADGLPLWDEVHPADDSRGACGPDMTPTPFVVCRTCGHEHSSGAWYTAMNDDHDHDPDEQARLMVAAQARSAERIRAALRNSSFRPIRCPAGRDV